MRPQIQVGFTDSQSNQTAFVINGGVKMLKTNRFIISKENYLVLFMLLSPINTIFTKYTAV